mmetsp:Transcript_5604/g.7974  ORF Transcript_5604/g.7974 Transcript_5604/m.7974 type:complete len:413 (+) Transcript_5604:78-1316(+)
MKAISLTLICLVQVVQISAWVPHSIQQKRISSSALQMSSNEKSVQNRRQWLSGVATAAVGSWSITGTNTWAVDSGTVVETTPAIDIGKVPELCDASVSTWRNPSNGRIVYLLGTAHISSASAELAGNLVKDVRPEAVFVELDAKRVGKAGFGEQPPSQQQQQQSEQSPEPSSSNDAAAPSTATTPAPKSTEVISVAPPLSESGNEGAAPPKKANPFDLRQRALQMGSAAVGNTIKGMYKKLDSAGFQAGEEFVVAVREGQKVGSKIVLGDRDVEVTLRRVTEALAKTDIKSLLSPDSELERSMKQLLPPQEEGGSALVNEDLKDEKIRKEFSQYVETMKAKENVKVLMEQLKKLAPELHKALVAERDAYMANGLNSLDQFSSIVAVMGIAHVDGVEENLRGHGWVPVPLTCK